MAARVDVVHVNPANMPLRGFVQKHLLDIPGSVDLGCFLKIQAERWDILLMGSRNPAITTWDENEPVNHGINYQAQLVQDF